MSRLSSAEFDRANRSTDTIATQTNSETEAEKFELVLDGKDRPTWCFSTVAWMFHRHEDWVGCLRLDKFLGAVMLYKPIPGTEEPLENLPREITDRDYIHAAIWCNRNGFPRTSKEVLHGAIDAVAGENAVDPIADWLLGLRWDRQERLSGWLSTYLGAEDCAYSRAVGRPWMISAVARALDPGCKADNCLVLEGDQGTGKSTVLRVLAGDQYFGDPLPDLSNKDASSYLRGKWIVELSELAALAGPTLEATKAFMSRQVERYRPAYAIKEIEQKRRCVFAGTTNAHDYLRDSTGSRRFWPVRTGAIEIEALKSDRDQLWAEAAHAFRSGETWWLNEVQAELAASVQAERTEEDPWLGPVMAYCEGREAVACKGILSGALNFLDGQMTRKETNRVSALLRRLGYERDGQFSSGDLKGAGRFVRKT